MNSVQLEIGSRIAKARRFAGLSQSELAKALGVSRGAVVKWELGRSEPMLSRLSLIAETLRCSVGYLIDAEDFTENKGGKT